jgi:hypothetical protein
MTPSQPEHRTELTRAVSRAARRQADEYSGDADRPLGSYAAVLGVYGVVVAGLAGVVHLTGRRLPRRLAPYDLVLATVATHKVSRRLAKDPVASPLRAPFTRFAGTTGPAELKEEVRGTGVRKAVGELITCPFCLSQWVATAFVFGLVLAPRTTRLVAATFTVLAGSDFLQFVYASAEQRAQG